MRDFDFPVIGIDPGYSHSGVAVLLPGMNLGPCGHWPNSAVAKWLSETRAKKPTAKVAVEMLSCYKTNIGRTTFDTALMVGRVLEAIGEDRCFLLTRPSVLNFLSGMRGTTKAQVRAAVFDYFPSTGGGTKPQIGTKQKPGPLYAMRGCGDHVVDALAVAIAFIEGADQYTLALEKSTEQEL